jgi:hypothetical protein
MEVDQGPNWGCSAKEKKIHKDLVGGGCDLCQDIVSLFAFSDWGKPQENLLR